MFVDDKLANKHSICVGFHREVGVEITFVSADHICIYMPRERGIMQMYYCGVKHADPQINRVHGCLRSSHYNACHSLDRNVFMPFD